MARTIKNAKTDTRSARLKLKARREPYWVVISKGCALGYRKGGTGGTWIARYRLDSGKHRYQSLGAADDAMDSEDGPLCLTYANAQKAAIDWFTRAAHGFEEETPRKGPYTVKQALADYMASQERRGKKSVKTTQQVIDARIIPYLGDIPVTRLKRRQIEEWLEKISKAKPHLRTKVGKAQKHRDTSHDPEADRRRKSTANRILNVLRAALNHAVHERKVSSDEAWRYVRSFREVDTPRVRFLSDSEAQALVQATALDFRPVVQAALMTGCRYGELCALRVQDFDSVAGTLHIRQSKSGKPRHVTLTDEGQALFQSLCEGKAENDLILTKNGTAWGKSHQHRPFQEACTAAGLSGRVTFHALRHTHASRLIRKVHAGYVAKQLGHSDTRMVEKHYGHLAHSVVAETIRANFPSMGILADRQTDNEGNQ